MSTPNNQTPTTKIKNEADNIAYRIGNKIHDWRENRAREKGLERVVVANQGYGSTSWVRVLGRALYKTDGFEEIFDSITQASSTETLRGWRSFTSIAIRHAAVKVIIDDQHEFTITADEGGVIDVKLAVNLEPGMHKVVLDLEDGDSSETEVFVVPDDQKIGILSDIDDTVMVTALPRPMLAAWNSFVVDEHARTPTPGMSVLMDRLHQKYPQAPIMYLSTGAWNITPTLTRFLSRNGYPKGTFLLTDWGPTADRWFRSGAQHKVNSLKRLAEEFPNIKWILIGDDGQRDPDVYSGFAVRYPQNVASILIRNLTVGESVLANPTRVWADNRSKQITREEFWNEANDGTTFRHELEKDGLL
ncbi:App1 family protein [Rothia terrae]|uniref:App1 family protein n=1 Tax=Rothia terrae TaxID=396015 RepID=UPI00381872F6